MVWLQPLQFVTRRVSHSPVAESKSKLQYKRVVVKLSGEALASPESGLTIDSATISATAAELAEVRDSGIQVAVVVGGAISSEVCAARVRGWIGPRVTIWVCWQL